MGAQPHLEMALMKRITCRLPWWRLELATTENLSEETGVQNAKPGIKGRRQAEALRLGRHYAHPHDILDQGGMFQGTPHTT